MNIFIVIGIAVLAGASGYAVKATRNRSHDESAPETQALAAVNDLGPDIVDLLPIPIAVRSRDDRTSKKNRALSQLATGSTAILVDDAIDSALQRAMDGVQVNETLTFRGPPQLICELKAGQLNGSGVYAVLTDVTDKARMDSVRTDFVANISHELKTPIGAVAVLAEALIGETDQAVVSRLTARMLAESERASKTIDDLLELSQTEQSVSENTAVIVVEELLDSVKARYEEAAHQRHIEIVIEGAKSTELFGDRQQLASALGNLVDNAVKYSSEGGVVTLRSIAGAEGVTIEVCDTGVGIPNHDLDRIFERFYRVDKARSRGTGGTGLGLAIVRHVANNHGGSIEVTSVEGEGSCFRLILPKEPAE